MVSKTLKKNLILILALILILISGFFIFEREKAKEVQLAKNLLENLKVEISQAENALIFKDEKKANILFQQVWQNLLPLTQPGFVLRKEAQELQKSILTKLESLNNLEKIENPQLLFDFSLQKREFFPQKILFFNSQLYFSNPFSNDIYQLEITQKTENILIALEKPALWQPFSDSILFFSKPNKLVIFKDGQFGELITLKSPISDFSFDALAIFKSNLYFLDQESGEILKFEFGLTGSPRVKEGQKELTGKPWLNPKTKRPAKARSLAVDGSIWILTKDKEINRYYAGFYQETLKLNFFPFLENPTKILTLPTLPYLYLLEPDQNRIIILGKNGEIFKQFQSPKFDNLLDFTISSDGKVIYILNGQKIYQITL